MKRFRYTVLGLAAGLLLVAPQTVEAQGGPAWWDWALGEEVELRSDSGARALEKARRDGRTLDDVILGREGDRKTRKRAKAKGPPFCRNGQGHPVHGREWCRDKGFGLGSATARWEDRRWEDIIFGTPRRSDRRRNTLDRDGLVAVLGEVVLGRIEGERRRQGGQARLEGRWLEIRNNGGRVLQIRSGAVPVAELSDLDGDGRVDVALAPRR